MNNRSFTLPIVGVSIAVPLLVLVLFVMNKPNVHLGFDLRLLPMLNAALNFTTALLLITGRWLIARKKITAHRNVMIAAFCLSSLFLVSYVTYHALAPETRFGGIGSVRYVYFFILVTHIMLAAAIVPMVLFTLARGLQARYDRHRRIARWTFPLWLYVAVTGVVVYLMLSPYYAVT